MKNETTRRDFVKQLTLASSVIFIPPYLYSCKEKLEVETPEALMGSTDAPFGVWKQMITALEKSPDHLPGRRKLLIASKDPKAMTEFVRDNIQLVPQHQYFLNYASQEILYGVDGALRSGIGTAREKAEILKNMLVESGFEARIVVEKIGFTEDEIKDLIFRSFQPEFNPPISAEQIKNWQKTLGADPANGKVQEIPESSKQSDAFSKQFLTDLAGFDYKNSKNTFVIFPGSIPSVAFIENGVEKYAHIFDPSVPFGSLHPNNESENLVAALPMKVLKNDINISLTYRTVQEHTLEKEILSGTWGLEDILGSTISLEFMNNMDFKTQVTSTISQINTFTPIFSFQKIGSEKAYMEALTIAGEPINLEGKKILRQQESTTKQELKKNKILGNTNIVDNLEIKVLPLVFPEARLELYPRDSNGNIVEGLTAHNFILSDNQMPVSGLLMQTGITPKVMVLYDTSGSMPDDYRDKNHMDQFTRDLEILVQDFYPQAKIQAKATGSNIYTSLLKEKQSDFDLIIYATDGDNDDKFDPIYSEIYESGQPIIILEVREESHTYEELKKNITNLKSIPATNRETVKQEIKTVLSKISFPPYVMTFSSFGENDSHIMKVILNDKNIAAETNFKFPSQNDLFLGDRMIGLYLTITANGFSERRTLAGWDTEINYYENSRTYVDQVHEMMLGGVVMAFEGEAPSLSIRLTEYLTSLLSNEKWFNAQKEGDVENAIKYLEEGTLTYQPILLSLMQPLTEAFSKESITFPNGFRSCILKMKPALKSKNSVVSFDYLPSSKYITLSRSGDGKYNFTQTLKKTMQFAELEAEMFQDSTIHQLKDKKLIQLAKAKQDPRFHYSILKEKDPVFLKRIFSAGELTFFDESLTSTAYFKINSNTGELYANLPDGSGGGGTSKEYQLKELKKVVDEYQQLISSLQMGISLTNSSPGLGAVANYTVTLVQLYAAVSETLIVMDASNLNKQAAQALRQYACSILKDIIYLKMGKAGDKMSGFENLIGMMGGNFSFAPC